MPKCLTASLEFLFPRNKIVLDPVGARRASWSRVRTSPPAFRMRSLAAAVKRRAATDTLGTSKRRTSSVTVPIVTMVFESRSEAFDVSFTMREREIGGRLVFERKRRCRMVCRSRIRSTCSKEYYGYKLTLLNAESVRRARKRYS